MMNTHYVTEIEPSNAKSASLIHKALVVLGMMMLMGAPLTGVMTYMTVGYSETFISDWLSSFFTAAVTVMPLGFFMMVLITALTERLLPNLQDKFRHLVIGVAMACVMESIMAFTTAVNTIGFGDQSALLTVWFSAFVAALPVGMILMMIISLTIKPKVEQFLRS